MAEDFDNHRRSSMPVLSVSKGIRCKRGRGSPMNFLTVLPLTRYRLFPSPKSSPTNFRTGSMSSYFAKLVSIYLPPSLGT